MDKSITQNFMNIYSKQTILKFTIVQESCIVSVREVRAVDIHAGSSSSFFNIHHIDYDISLSNGESEKMSH